MARAAAGWLVAGWIGYGLLPWYATGSLLWPIDGSAPAGGSALAIALAGRAPWLLPIVLALLAALRPLFGAASREESARWLVAAGGLGLLAVGVQAFAIGLNGWALPGLGALLGEPGPAQAGLGYGAALTILALLMLLCHGLAARG